MKLTTLLCAGAALVAAQCSAQLLSIDFGERGQADPATTQPGFNAFFVNTSQGAATAAQTNATTRVFDVYTVTLRGNGANPGYDDRIRTTPVDAGDFTQSLLLRDFIFSTSTAADAGLNIDLSGFAPETVYAVTIWSFDSGSPNPRVSDWFANGTLVKDNYTFASTPLPTADDRYQFTFKVVSTAEGTISIAARRDATSTAAAPSVFLNALQVDETTPEPPTWVAEPKPLSVYPGESATFTAAVNGTAPITYRWLKDGNPIPGGTNNTLVIPSVSQADAALYSVDISNPAGTLSSDEVGLTVLPVASLRTALVAYWPLDMLADITPDRSGNGNDAGPFSLDGSSVVPGHTGNAVQFDGAEDILIRSAVEAIDLPVFTVRQAYTVAMWVKGNGIGQSDRRVFSEGSTTNNTPLLNIGTQAQGTNASLNVYIRGDNGAAPLNHPNSTYPVFDGEWHHIAFTDDNGNATLYVDGQPDPTNHKYGRVPLTLNNTTIGGIQRATNSHHFAGLIDEVALWKRALSADEVRQVMATGPLPPDTITRISVEGDTVTLTVSSASTDFPHTVLAATAADSDTWTPVGDVVTTETSPGVLTFRFAKPPGRLNFYRVSY